MGGESTGCQRQCFERNDDLRINVRIGEAAEAAHAKSIESIRMSDSAGAEARLRVIERTKAWCSA